MLRIHFTGEDLARTRLAPAPEPLWEIVLSMHVLRKRHEDATLTPWKQRVLAALRPGEPLRSDIDILLQINPPLGYFPDFLTPATDGACVDEAIERVVETPRDVLRREIAMLERRTAGLEDLRQGSSGAVRALGEAMRRYREAALNPIWDRVCAAVRADQAVRARIMAEQGVEAMVGGIHPAMRWAGGGVLEISGYREDQDLHLDGRGLVLVPSFFKTSEMPLKLADPELPQVLVYPVRKSLEPAAPVRREALAALVGRTRAAVMEALTEGCTTTELARKLSISLSAASEHAAVLRDSGLVMSVRDANRVIHTLTPLGMTLLG